jgi:hypothetical protein
MKKMYYFSILLFFIAGLTLSAQTGVRFGIKAGYSMATQYGTPTPDDSFVVETDSRNGFAGGVFVYFPITESVGIQQELWYTMKGSRQDVTFTDMTIIPGVPVTINTVSEYNINYFEMPMLLRYTFVKIKNIGIYGSSGIALSLLLNGGDYDIESTVNLPAPAPPQETNESGNTDLVDTFDYSFLYGAGADFKLLNKDFFVEYRMSVGWNTLAMPNVEGADPVPLRNMDYIFALGLYF